jgi:hypothetical protein
MKKLFNFKILVSFLLILTLMFTACKKEPELESIKFKEIKMVFESNKEDNSFISISALLRACFKI